MLDSRLAMASAVGHCAGMQTQRVGLWVAVVATVDIVANVSGIFADFPGFVGKGGSMIQALYNMIGISGFALAVGLSMFAWGTWGKRLVGRFRSETDTIGPSPDRPSKQKAAFELVELRDSLAETQQFVTALTKKSEETESRLAERSDLSVRVDVLIAATTRAEQRLADLDDDISVLLYNARVTTSYMIINNLLDHAPNLESIKRKDEFIETANNYVRYVRSELRDTDLEAQLDDLLRIADGDAQARFRAMSRDEIPNDAHPDVFRQFLISGEQWSRTLSLLKSYRLPITEDNRLGLIGERLKLRQP